jgi:hypothetical protein
MASGAGRLFLPQGLGKSHRTLRQLPEQVSGLWKNRGLMFKHICVLFSSSLTSSHVKKGALLSDFCHITAITQSALLPPTWSVWKNGGLRCKQHIPVLSLSPLSSSHLEGEWNYFLTYACTVTSHNQAL